MFRVAARRHVHEVSYVAAGSARRLPAGGEVCAWVNAAQFSADCVDFNVVNVVA